MKSKWILKIISVLRRQKLHSRLLSAFLLVVLLPLTLISVTTYLGFRSSILHSEENMVLLMSQYLESKSSHLMSVYPSKLNTMASDMELIRMMRRYQSASVLEAQTLEYQLSSRLISEATGMQGLMSLEIMDVNGRSITSLPYSIINDGLFHIISTAGEKYAFWLGQYRWGSLYASASRSKRDCDVLLVARQVVDYANNRLLGYLLISLNCQTINQQWGVLNQMQCFLSDAQGRVLTHQGSAPESARLLAEYARVEPTQTVTAVDDEYLMITQAVSGTPYHLSLAIGYDEMLSGLTRTIVLILLISAFIACVMISIALLVTRSVTAPVSRLSKSIHQFGQGDFTVRVADQSEDEIGKLCGEFDQMSEQVCALTQRVYLAEIREKDAQYKALQAQINPHFLYNTLDMISWMGYEANQPEICKVVQSLSEFFRISLSGGEGQIPLRDELRHVLSYISVQQHRMKNVRFYVIAPNWLGEQRVPKIVLQPLVENALQHGLKPNNYQGSIVVSCSACQNKLLLRVWDNGVGFQANCLEENIIACSGYGLRNIQERIGLLYGEPFGLTLRNHPLGGVLVTICLPFQEKEDANENSDRR